MEVQLQELIEQIKKDGVAAAEAEAKAILEQANAQAEQIIAEAKTQAEKLLSDAKAETQRNTKSGEEAIRQAGRNLLLSFRESVTRELQAITAENVTAAYASEALPQLIADTVACWAKQPDAEDLAIILPGDALKNLEGALLAALKEKMLTGVTLKANDNFSGGFRIAVNQGSAYYDFSTEAVVEMLSGYLSPRVADLLKEA